MEKIDSNNNNIIIIIVIIYYVRAKLQNKGLALWPNTAWEGKTGKNQKEQL